MPPSHLERIGLLLLQKDHIEPFPSASVKRRLVHVVAQQDRVGDRDAKYKRRSSVIRARRGQNRVPSEAEAISSGEGEEVDEG